jgi:threonylcarbamoyladenosine tRNA methylthiotransferase MtaB
MIVTGCAAQIDPTAFAAMPEVDLVLGNAEKSANSRACLGVSPRRPGPRQRHHERARNRRPHGRRHLKDRARAFVEVQNGCDHRCTFCVIPYGRGNSRSVPAGEPSSNRSAASPHRATTRWC